MKKIFSIFILFSLFCQNSFAASDAATASTDHATVTLESEASHIQADTPFLIRLHFDLADGWHIYWQNPGDSGLPVSINWQLPEGFSTQNIQWPIPERILVDGLMNYGYHHQANLLIPVLPPKDLTADKTINLAAKVSWLICKETCIPESGQFTLELTTATKIQPGEAAPRIAEAMQALPQPATMQGMLTENTAAHGLDVSWKLPASLRQPSEVYFYPELQGVIEHAAEQKWSFTNGSLSATLARGTEILSDPLRGILQLDNTGYLLEFSTHPSALDHPEATAPAQKQKTAAVTPQTSTGLLSALFFALLGGLLLNAMPCVFPVLSLKALAISKKAGGESAKIRKQGLAYLLGTMLTFSLLALVLITLKQAGYAAGWGFQLQNPFFVGAMLLLFLALGLGLAGMFEFPQILGGIGQEKTAQDNASGSFFTGVLAVLVATPCTVPFMAPALSYAFTQSTAHTVVIMLAMGLGMALPYLLISFVPAAQRMLPRPGAWMEGFKQFMAFPMFATAAWLLWVLAQQVDTPSFGIILLWIVMLPFSLWLGKGRSPLWQKVLALLTLGLVAYSLSALQVADRQMPTAGSDSHTIAYHAKELEKLRAEGKAVFLDATAAWCLTCKVNENGVLKSKAIKTAFAENNIITMIADWTNNDPAITALLESFDHQGVPLYVYYPPAGEPKVLPQILTEQIVLDAINQK